jgi:hypothetical protein
MGDVLTYNPNVDSLITPIEPTEMTVDEELARQALNHNERTTQKTVPTGLIKRQPEPEKKIDESQMADFSTPIEDVMAGSGQMLQNEVMGSAYAHPQRSVSAPRKQSGDTEATKGGKNPLGLTDEQFQAAIAGVAAVIAFAKPVQSRLRTMVPKFVDESGETSLTGLAVTALIAAIIFYFARKFLNDHS